MQQSLEKWDPKMKFTDCSGAAVPGRVFTMACPHCYKGFILGHLSWSAMVCGNQFGGCGKSVKKEEFIRIKSGDRRRLLRWKGDKLVVKTVKNLPF